MFQATLCVLCTRKDGGIQILVEHVKNDPILECLLDLANFLSLENRTQYLHHKSHHCHRGHVRHLECLPRLAFKQILGAANRRIRAVRRTGLDDRWGMVQRPITPWLLDMLNHDWEAHPVAVPCAYRGHMFVATASHTPVDRYFALNIARPGARAMLKYSVLTCLEIVV